MSRTSGQYQGMVVNGGISVDFFSPGNNSEILIMSSEIDPNVDKYKFQISPRLGFAFPITDRTSSTSITDGSRSGRTATSFSGLRTCSTDRAFSATPISTRSSPFRIRRAFRTSSARRSPGTSSSSTRTSSASSPRRGFSTRSSASRDTATSTERTRARAVSR